MSPLNRLKWLLVTQKCPQLSGLASLVSISYFFNYEDLHPWLLIIDGCISFRMHHGIHHCRVFLWWEEISYSKDHSTMFYPSWWRILLAYLVESQIFHAIWDTLWKRECFVHQGIVLYWQNVILLICNRKSTVDLRFAIMYSSIVIFWPWPFSLQNQTCARLDPMIMVFLCSLSLSVVLDVVNSSHLFILFPIIKRSLVDTSAFIRLSQNSSIGAKP